MVCISNHIRCFMIHRITYPYPSLNGGLAKPSLLLGLVLLIIWPLLMECGYLFMSRSQWRFSKCLLVKDVPGSKFLFSAQCKTSLIPPLPSTSDTTCLSVPWCQFWHNSPVLTMLYIQWWRHQMETFSALLALYIASGPCCSYSRPNIDNHGLLSPRLND